MSLQYIAPNKRGGMTRTKAARIFLREGGICHICGNVVRQGEPYEIEHPTALADGGSDDEADLRVAHVKCHAAKTATETTARARRDRIVTASWAGKPRSTLSKQHRREVLRKVAEKRQHEQERERR